MMGWLRHRGERVNRMRDMAPAEVSRAYEQVMGAMSRQYDAAAQTILGGAPAATCVLDVGTGPGFLPPRLARAFPSAKITGLDTGAEMLALARQRAAAEGVGDRVAFIEGSAYDMPFPDGSFDLVVATNAVHMFDDLAHFTAEARRVLKRGGTLVVLDNRRDVSWPVYAVMWGSTLVLRILGKPVNGMGPVIDASYTESEVEAALASAGFEQRNVSARAVRLEAFAQA